MGKPGANPGAKRILRQEREAQTIGKNKAGFLAGIGIALALIAEVNPYRPGKIALKAIGLN